MGIISSLPKSITNERIVFEKYENDAYEANASPKAGPILLKQATTDVIVVIISLPSKDIRIIAAKNIMA